MTRRDKCFEVGRAANRLPPKAAARAWHHLATAVEQLGEADVPKFIHLLRIIRAATIKGKGP